MDFEPDVWKHLKEAGFTKRHIRSLKPEYIDLIRNILKENMIESRIMEWKFIDDVLPELELEFDQIKHIPTEKGARQSYDNLIDAYTTGGYRGRHLDEKTQKLCFALVVSRVDCILRTSELKRTRDVIVVD